ncbi:MAG: CoA-binding protein [Candidatus Bilamarchaeaceae archaeon]
MSEDFLKKSNKLAVVGASREKEKFGYKIYLTLKKQGFVVYPVNPKADKIDKDKCYPSLSSLPQKPDVVITVVPPKITEQVVIEAAKLGIDKIWMQPGSESEKAIALCKEKGIKFIAYTCFIVDGLKINFF